PPPPALGKDGTPRKKRGRKPTPGLSEEQRRQARLLKNRRTAATSRRRKMALMHSLVVERDCARRVADRLAALVGALHRGLADERCVSVPQLLRDEPHFVAPVWPPFQSHVSCATSVAHSDVESVSCNKNSKCASTT
ncbi:unnamed protein product, partial [Agarophyton chilense]